MKREQVNERRHYAAQMEMVMLAATAVGIFTTAMMFFAYGLLASFAMLVLTTMAYGLSCVFDFIADLLTVLPTDERKPTEHDKI